MTLPLTNPQLARVRDTGSVLRIDRVEPQPDDWTVRHVADVARDFGWEPRIAAIQRKYMLGFSQAKRIKDLLARAPLGPPGTEHGVGEEWRMIGGADDPRIEYRSGGVLEIDTAELAIKAALTENAWPSTWDHMIEEMDTGRTEWRSADTLPDWAVRTRVVVESVEVKRAGEITEEKARAAGGWPDQNDADFAWLTRLRRVDA